MSEMADLADINQAFRLLTCPDPVVAELALEGLAASAGFNRSSKTTKEALLAYINGETPGNSNVETTFSHAREATKRVIRRLGDFEWGWSEEKSSFQLKMRGDKGPLIIDKAGRRNLTHALRRAAQIHKRNKLSSKLDQGRVARVLAQSPITICTKGGTHKYCNPVFVKTLKAVSSPPQNIIVDLSIYKCRQKQTAPLSSAPCDTVSSRRQQSP